MPLPGKPRRITKLHVEEISLVDRPANKAPFLLYKRDDSVNPGAQQEEGQPQPAGEVLATPPAIARFVKDDGSSSSARRLVGYDSDAVMATIERVTKGSGDSQRAINADAKQGFSSGGSPVGADTLKGQPGGPVTAAVGFSPGQPNAGSQTAVSSSAQEAEEDKDKKPVGAERLQDQPARVVTEAVGFNPGQPNAGSQPAI